MHLFNQDEHPTIVAPATLLRRTPEFMPWRQARELLHGPNLCWVRRKDAEANLELTQIIPSAIICDHPNRFHTFRRCPSDFVQLSEKLSIIIGGHCDLPDAVPYPEDPEEPDAFYRYGRNFHEVFARTVERELLEEVNLRARVIAEPLAIVTDRSTPKTAQHVALIYRVQCHRRLYANAPEEFSTRLAENGIIRTTEELRAAPDDLDPWTRIIVQNLP